MQTTVRLIGTLVYGSLLIDGIACGGAGFTTLTAEDGDQDGSADAMSVIVPGPDGATTTDGGAVNDSSLGESSTVTTIEDGGSPPLDASCVDTSSSTANCGACGHACTTPTGGSVACANSACVQTCPTGQEACQNQCLSDDNLNNCGGCGNVCPGPANGSNGSGVAQCVDAGCVLQCASGAHVCGADCLLNTDPPSTDPCIVSSTYGVFVSPSGSDTSGNGTKASPYATIGKAASAAKTAGLPDVFACGTFTTAVTINSTMDGERIYGGFNCSTWAWSGSTSTVVAPTSPGVALTINGITTGVTFANFAFEAMSAPANTGDSVIAALVNSSSNVNFSDVTIQAGNAATGVAGSTTSNYSGTAQTGNPANGTTSGGILVCSACQNPPSNESVGGSGGSSSLNPGPAGSGNAGQSNPAVGSPASNGGSGETLTAECDGGTVGGFGNDGAGGTTTTLTLSLTAGGVAETGGIGGNGGYGTVAQGGGGGGGGFFTVGTAAGGGGGGGCGGCGGGYGTGGSPGGTSIALASVSSTITLSGGTLAAGAGGTGGKGGDGQVGETGGAGGSGATPGCGGGQGGQGGQGGGGAGGAGGSSFALAYTGTAPTVTNGTQFNASTQGSGGVAGTGGSAQSGNAGTSSTTPTQL